MTIYDYVFGVSTGQAQVCCCFHDDTRASAGIGPDNQFHCFVCQSNAHDDTGFIQKYFKVSEQRAKVIKDRLDKIDKYKPTANPITQEQRDYLHSIGLIDNIIDKYFICQSNGKLVYVHKWNSIDVGYTWFNNPCLSNYNAGEEKYKYSNTTGGMITPTEVIGSTILICEGEKDMLTARSKGLAYAVAKVGGAMTPILCTEMLRGKNIVLCYDCDDSGRKGAMKDAELLTTKLDCKVKVIDLGLQNKEDLNDFFMKYNKTTGDLFNIIRNTPLFTVSKQNTLDSKIDNIINSLSSEEIQILKVKLGGN